MTQPSLILRRWQRVEYERLVDLGMFEGDRVELIGGQLVVAEPQGSYHASVVGALTRAFQGVIPPGWIVRGQMPLALDDESAPEPDLAVLRGSHTDYRHSHPARAALVVEVAESSLELDREHKGSLYARAGLHEYWIVNLIDAAVEVYRDPTPDPSAEYGWRYRSAQTVTRGNVVSPAALPSVQIAVASFLA